MARLALLPVPHRTEDIAIVEVEHRQHAVVELTIRDLKDQALAHFPSGAFAANSAWIVIACLAHNLSRSTTVIGLPGGPVCAACTLRRRLPQIPGRLTRTARQWTLHLFARSREHGGGTGHDDGCVAGTDRSTERTCRDGASLHRLQVQATPD